MKRFFCFLCLLLCCIMFAGCTQPEDDVLKLTTKESQLDAWGYYNEYFEFQSSISDQIKDCSNQTFLSQHEKENTIQNALTNVFAVVDCYEHVDHVAYFDFENMKNYKIQEINSKRTYTITYDQRLERNLLVGGDEEVDNLIFDVLISNQVKANVSKNVAGVYTFKLTQNISVPTEIEDFEEERNLPNGNIEKVSMICEEVVIGSGETAYVKTILTAEKSVKNQNGALISSYKRKSEFFKKSGSYYLNETVISGSTEKTKTIRLENIFSNITVSYNKEVGSIVYKIPYDVDGKLEVNGEIYLVEDDVFYVKENLKLVSGNPFGYEKSQVLEKTGTSTAFKLKYFLGKNDPTALRDVNIKTFADQYSSQNTYCAEFENNKLIIKIG